MVREFEEEAIISLIRAIGGLDELGKADGLKAKIEELKHTFGVHVVEEPVNDVSRGRQDAYHRVTFRMIRVKPGSDGIAMLDLSGTMANLSLRFENCEFDVLDVAFANLHSIDLRGWRPASSSKFFERGGLIFARGLELRNEFYMGAGKTLNQVAALYAHGMKAKEVQLFSTELSGGNIAGDIWQKLIEELDKRLPEAKSKKECDELEVIIDVHTAAARRYLKTLDLACLEAETLFISVKSRGMVDLHDARIHLKLLVEAGKFGAYRRVNLVAWSRTLLDRKLHGWKESHRASKRKKTELGDRVHLAVHFAEMAEHLSGRLSPCIDLGGVECKGELRFDGPEKGRDAEPPVVGFVNLANARCNVFTDDGQWLALSAKNVSDQDPDHPLRFGLNCFKFDFFGRSPRFIANDDAESKRSGFFSRLRGADAVTDAIAVERERRDAEGHYVGALVVKHEDGHRPDKVLMWLKASRSWTNELTGGPHDNRDQFDAQPWTHSAKVMRQAGWHDEAEEVLYEREKSVRWREQASVNKRRWIEKAVAVSVGLAAVFLTMSWAWLRTPETTVDVAMVAFVWLIIAKCAQYRLDFDAAPAESAKARLPSLTIILAAGFVVALFVYGCGTSFRWLELLAQFRYDEQYPFCRPTENERTLVSVLLIGLTTVLLAVFGVVERGFTKVGHLLLQLTIGFGYKPMWAIAQSLLIVLLGALVYSSHYLPIGGERLLENNAQDMIREPSKSSSLSSTDLTPSVGVAVGADAARQRLISMSDYRDCAGEDRQACQLDERSDLKPVPSVPPVSVEPKPAPHVTENTTVRIDPQDVVMKEDDEKPYPRFNALMYSVDVFIPVIDFSQGTYWLPGHERKAPERSGEPKDDPKHDDLGWLWAFYWFQIAAGWWYSSVLVAKFTGFLERKE